MPRTRVNLNVSGPLFDGRADSAVFDWLDNVKQEVANLGVQEIQGRAVKFNRSKRATGHYASQINTRRFGSYNDQLINDRGIVYGPWLEGTSKRNQSTRFKGYHQFRRVRTRLRKLFPDLAEKRLRGVIWKMGGKTL